MVEDNLMKNLKISWLGSPIIEFGNSVVRMETRKATALLAYLFFSNKPSSREHLANLFWPEFDQIHAHANLRRTLSSVLTLIGPDFLQSNREIIGVAPDAIFWQDVSEFDLLISTVNEHKHSEFTHCQECLNNLEKAISLYRSDFLEGINLKECPEFDDWQYLTREGFREKLTFSLEKLALAYIAQADWERAIQKSRQWVSMDRLNENAQRMLIKIYALAGQRSAALRQFEDCSRWLLDELGQPPEDETISLINQVQSGEIGKSEKPRSHSVGSTATEMYVQPLITTKLFAPHLPSGLIPRPFLFKKLEQGAQSALTVISAPAGYGKTTILSEWIEARQKIGSSTPSTTCWLSLDEGDNDPIRFLNYLTASIEKVHPGVGKKARTLLENSQPFLPQMPLSMLINDLQALPQSIMLVLDDYQFIENPVIHDGIIFLLDHMPDNVHLVVATRSDPPFPLARLRARNQLSELRANDLRFSIEETASFLKNVFGLILTPEQVLTLETRTEGWIAGVQLAAISMQGRSDVSQFIEAFSGSHRFIMDYLTEEALNRQTVEIKDFLIRTSILERLSDPLCKAILNGEAFPAENELPPKNDPGSSPGDSQTFLKQLEISNLFIIPLDDDRIWYRYHHLFADLLRTRLEQTSPGLIPTIHARASTWFENNGWIEESITHSMAAKDWDNASRLLDNHFHTFLENGQMTTVLKWIEGFPQEVILSDPKLCALVAEVYSQAGMIDQIDPLLDRAEEILTIGKGYKTDPGYANTINLSRKEKYVILSMAKILRGLKSVCSGDPTRAIELTQKALVDFPEMEPRELAVLFWVEGWAYRSLGKLGRSMEVLTKASELADSSGAILRDIWTDLANATRLVGKLRPAIEILSNSLQTATERGVQNQGNLSRDETFLSMIFLEQNHLDLALNHATRAIAYTQWWPSHIIIAMAYASLAQILLARDDLNGSILAIQKADQEGKNRLMTPFVHSIVKITWARIWLVQGDWVMLDQWANDLMRTLSSKSDKSNSIDEYLEMQLIQLVRVWIEKTKKDKNTERNGDCLQLLERLINNSQEAGRFNSLVEILILKGSIQFSCGEIVQSFNCLEKCFFWAESGGYVRIFLNTGEPARNLIAAYLKELKPAYKSYALKILKEFGGYSYTQSPASENPDQITSREKDILHLLAEGYSNQQIADKLVLAEGTIKFHVHNILQKLQVNSRTQAIARAKDLEII